MNRWHHDEQGVALVTVLGVLSVLTILVTGLLAYATTSMRQAARDEDTTAALAAAEAGVDDFLHRLNRDAGYWQTADPDWNGGAGTPDPDNPALAGFTPMPGSASNGSFTYTVDASAIAAEGNVEVIATGRADGQERTVRAVLRRRGFLDYLYFTDYEVVDPALDDSISLADCKVHDYNGRDPDKCTQIYWADADVVDGPFHTNDIIRIFRLASPTWTREATTSWTGLGNRHWQAKNGGSDASPDFQVGGDAVYDEPLEIPPSNDAIKAEADPDVDGEGCLYVGPTYIELVGDQMRVTSRETADPNPPGATVCRTDGSLQPIPDNGVVYVANSPGPTTAKPHPYTLALHNLSGSTKTWFENYFDETPYDPKAGDAYVEGALDGRLTIAAENDVVFVGDTCYATCADTSGRGGDDLLGIVANNFVEVYHPITWQDDGDGSIEWSEIVNVGFKGGNPWTNVRIDAAILSMEHSFRVQFHGGGPKLGTLDVHGAIAQLFRGAVGTNIPTGYDKLYSYDERLKYQSPPHFIDPVQSAWKVSQWSIERSP